MYNLLFDFNSFTTSLLNVKVLYFYPLLAVDLFLYVSLSNTQSSPSFSYVGNKYLVMYEHKVIHHSIMCKLTVVDSK